MNEKLFFVLVIVSITTHVIRLIYEVMKHKKLFIPGKISFVIILITMIILWLSWFLMCSIDVYKINMPAIIQHLGLLLTVAGTILFITGFITIRTLESYDGDLITTGIYSKIRHPMYVGFICWLIGFPVYSASLFSFILALIFTGNVLLWRYFEERELEVRFSSYVDYRKKTWF